MRSALQRRLPLSRNPVRSAGDRARGRAALLQAVPDAQRDVRLGFTVRAVDGDRVLAHWTASFRRASSGVQVALDGLFLLEFTEARTCRTLREWWHRSETPPAT